MLAQPSQISVVARSGSWSLRASAPGGLRVTQVRGSDHAQQRHLEPQQQAVERHEARAPGRLAGRLGGGGALIATR